MRGPPRRRRTGIGIGNWALLSSSSAAPECALFEPDRQLAMHAQPKLLLILSIVRHERVLSLRLLNAADLVSQIHDSENE